MHEQPTTEGRGEWRSRVGFVLAAAGSAIGLGNIWRFPAETARNGGAAFLLIYLACVAIVGVPVMIAELAIGRRTGRNPIGAFAALKPRTPWVLLGALGVVTGVAILSFYSVIAGWTVGYLAKAVRGEFSATMSAEAGPSGSARTSARAASRVLTRWTETMNSSLPWSKSPSIAASKKASGSATRQGAGSSEGSV